MTERQVEILRRIGMGDSYKEIAHALGLSYSTVRKHAIDMMEVTGVYGQIKLALYAIKNGYITLDEL